MIKSYHQYIQQINEKKLFIYHEKFKIYNLLLSGIYPVEKIQEWMKKYEIDEYAHCIFVTEKKPQQPYGPHTWQQFSVAGSLPGKELVKPSHYQIQNKVYFDSDVAKHQGWMPEDSKLMIGASLDSDIYEEIYLYIFKKNSNQKLRARQIHGFVYEADVRNLNGLKKLGKTAKWDAEGSLDKNFLQARMDQGKFIEYFDPSTGYQNMVLEDEVSGAGELNWDLIANSEFCGTRNWSIKCTKKGSSIEFGDFKRISGIELEHGRLKFIHSNEKYFILVLGIHDGTPEKFILTEYIILVPIETWKTYLPDIEGNLSEFEKMYTDLQNFRLKGERSDQSEAEWEKYMAKYKQLTTNSATKLRFKRDSKGQLRIQCAIQPKEFMEKVLQNPHIKIS